MVEAKEIDRPNEECGELISGLEQTNHSHSDPIIAVIGKFGRFQFRSFLLLSMSYLTTSWSLIIVSFLNVETDFWCARPQDHEQAISVQEWKSLIGYSNEDKCHMNNLNFDKVENHWTVVNSSRIACSSFEYDRAVFTETMTSEWNLVCHNAHGIGVAQSVYFFGQLFGVVFAGIMADKFGRKMTYIPLICMSAIFGIASSLVKNFEWFLVFRFLTAFVTIGGYESMFIWLQEVISGRWSAIISQSYFLVWVISWLSLTPFAYFLRNWRELLFATSIPKGFTFLLFWLLPESPKWILATGNYEEAEKVVKDIATINKKEERISEGWSLNPVQIKGNTLKHDGENDEGLSAQIWDLFLHKELRRKTVIMTLIGIAITSIYYGLSLNSVNIGGNPFVRHVISGLVEIPSYVGAMLGMNYFGRKYPFGLSLIFAGTVLILNNVVSETSWLKIALSFTGKSFITMSFGAMYVVISELYPTVVRTTGLAVVICCARVGAILAPWIAFLDRYNKMLPVITWGSMAILSGILALFLPETKGQKMPDSIKESEEFKVKWTSPMRA